VISVSGYRRVLVASIGLVAGVLLTPSVVVAQDTPVQVTVGESKTLELDGNPSTGYAWVLRDAAGSDGQVLSVNVRGYASAARGAGERPRLGAPAKFQILLTGVAPGRVSLTFDYVKSGTPKPASTRVFAVEVLSEAAAPPAGEDAAQEEAGEDPTADKPAQSQDDLFADPNDEEDGGGSPD